MSDLHVYDTTLRDGAQQEGLNLSVSDKLAIALHLDELGVGFIEGGWPGANPNDTAFFAAMADGQVLLKHAQLVAFGSASTPTTTPGARSPTRWPPSRPAPATCRARSTASASAPATAT